MPVRTITDLKLAGKRVLARCDFNVPTENGRIIDPRRIDASLDTIRYILNEQAVAVLCSHLGRPKERTPDLSLKPVAEYLSGVLGHKVALAPDCIGDVTGKMVAALKPGEAILLENLRFHPEEEANDRDFSHELARGKDAYVNDAFATAHRAHASTAGVTRFIAERAAGFLMMRELEALRAVVDHPEHPAAAILGGTKVSDKIGVIKNLLTKVDTVLVGGAMAYTFLRARGIAVGRSRVDEAKLDLARELIAEAERRNVGFVLPQDHVVAVAPDRPDTAMETAEIPADMMGLDIGPRTADDFIARLGGVKTAVWNGPLGYFEVERFARGTLQVAQALAETPGARTLVGGGDTDAAIGHQPWSHHFAYISTGGGATLEYLEGRELPGVKALEV
jgi:phosphoglycerate kinase